MYGNPALSSDFTHLPYVNPDAPKGEKIIFGNTGSFDSLNPFISKGTPPWQLRFLAYESLMARSYDEPFSLYGLLAESIHTAEDRKWVEFKLRPEAEFWDGSKVTVEDVIWSFETLGSKGNLRYRGLWSQIESIEKTAPRTVRISFKEDNRELALIASLRPILKKDQWKNENFELSGLETIPIGTGAYKLGDFEAGRYVELLRNRDYWGQNLPINRGTQNFDHIRIEFYGDQSILFEAFKAGELNVIRESNPEKWNSAYHFPRVLSGEVIKSEIPHSRPSGMTGLVMNTRRPPFNDWRVREAMIRAFNFEFINDTITGGTQPRITSYFSNSYLSMRPGRADATVAEFLKPLLPTQFPDVLEGYHLPMSDGTERNRSNLKSAMTLLNDVGWKIQDGLLKNKDGENFEFDLLLRQSERDFQNIADIYLKALQRLGINANIFVVDDAQYNRRVGELDFDMTSFRRDLSLSPGNEQKLYWGSEFAHVNNTRNLMGASSPEIDATITAMLNAHHAEEFQTAVRALDRILMSGRYVIPIWRFGVSRIAHDKNLKFPDTLPIYGDRGWLPHVWWYHGNP